MPYYGAMPGFAKLTQKKNAAILKKDYNALYTLFTCDGHLLSALCFDFRYLLCRCAHNPYALIAHTVKERVKLPPLRVLFRRRFVAHFLAALLAPCPRRLYRCPKSLEVVFWYWSFCHNYSPYYILLFTFLLGYVYTVLLVSQNNSYVYVDNYPLFLYSIIKRGKCLCYIACVFDKH